MKPGSPRWGLQVQGVQHRHWVEAMVARVHAGGSDGSGIVPAYGWTYD